MYNKVENYIRNQIKKYGTLCFPLIDSENQLDESLVEKKTENLGVSAV